MKLKIFTSILLLSLITFSCNKKQTKTSEIDIFTKNDSIIPKKKEKDPSSNSIKESIKVINENNEYNEIYKYFVEPNYDTTRTQIIKEDLALLVYPSDKQIDYLKEKNGEEVFYIVADDNNYYMFETITLLDSFKIKTITAKKRSLTFIGKQKDFGVDLDSVRQNSDSIYWSVILFNKSKSPIFLDMVEPDIENLKNYIKK